MMAAKTAGVLFFLSLFTCRAFSGIGYGLGVGYVQKNVYIDSAGVMEHERNVPLLQLSMGYQRNVNVVEFALDAHVKFYGMDLLRGNREYVVFAEPRGFIYVPLRISEFGISPTLGYGAVHRRRYIKERTYLSGEDRYVNPADFKATISDILYGATLLYGDWIVSSFLIIEEIESYHILSIQVRTPHCARSAPFISFCYAGGDEMRTFSLGLTFYR
jgi:hypothetical protein